MPCIAAPAHASRPRLWPLAWAAKFLSERAMREAERRARMQKGSVNVLVLCRASVPRVELPRGREGGGVGAWVSKSRVTETGTRLSRRTCGLHSVCWQIATGNSCAPCTDLPRQPTHPRACLCFRMPASVWAVPVMHKLARRSLITLWLLHCGQSGSVESGRATSIQLV